MKILAFGDSLTEGYITKETSNFYPYTTTLKKLLQMKIDNEGVSGERTLSMTKRIQSITKPYDYAIILAGTNDLDTRTAPSTIVSNIKNIHEYCINTLGVKQVFCLSLPEVTNGTKRLFERKRLEINAALLRYSHSIPQVIYVPFGETFSFSKRSNLFAGNGYHLSIEGYKVMASFIAFYINMYTCGKQKCS